MRRPRPLPVALTTGPFPTVLARELGVDHNRLRRSDLTAPFHGVRTTVDPTTIEELATAYSTRMPPHQYFSHITSATLLGLRLPQNSVSKQLHVSALPPATPPRSRGVIGHEGAGVTPVVLPNGLRVASPIDSWLQLGPTLPTDDLIVMGDGLLRRIRPPATLEQLRLAVKSNAGKRGQRKIVAAMREMRAGTDSARETLLRLLVIRAGFPEPVVNGQIRNSYGAVIAHADLAFPKFRTILEYDGGQHRTDARQFAIDIHRLDDLMEERWRVIRVDKYLMAQRATLIAKIDTALRHGGWTPP